mmetsp:Transcript_52158/g.60916  ORF Transcript_52158/g.60916 Transcript_52158/m.60916 type:complete len:92 (-) Transcript_52158:147-422(-)
MPVIRKETTSNGNLIISAFIGLFLKALMLVILYRNGPEWVLHEFRLFYEKLDGKTKRITLMSLGLGSGLHFIQFLVGLNRMVDRYSANLEV